MLRALALLLLTSSMAAAQSFSILPGGATSLRETFDDWIVSCAVQGSGKRCSLSQEQVNQNRQRVIAIELAPGENNSLNGVLVLPFGLLFEAGVTLQADDKPIGKPLKMRTCLPTGCLVPLQFDQAAAGALRAAAALKASAMPADGTNPVGFSVSLKGFSPALNRTVSLVR